MRCIDGFDETVGIKMTDKKKLLSENLCGVSYSALLWYFDTNNHYGNNPMNLPEFGLFLMDLKQLLIIK